MREFGQLTRKYGLLQTMLRLDGIRDLDRDERGG
jgi:hypothetical protein